MHFKETPSNYSKQFKSVPLKRLAYHPKIRYARYSEAMILKIISLINKPYLRIFDSPHWGVSLNTMLYLITRREKLNISLYVIGNRTNNHILTEYTRKWNNLLYTNGNRTNNPILTD